MRRNCKRDRIEIWAKFLQKPRSLCPKNFDAEFGKQIKKNGRKIRTDMKTAEEKTDRSQHFVSSSAHRRALPEVGLLHENASERINVGKGS